MAISTPVSLAQGNADTTTINLALTQSMHHSRQCHRSRDTTVFRKQYYGYIIWPPLLPCHQNERTLFDIFGDGLYNKEFFSTGLRRSSGQVLIGDELATRWPTISPSPRNLPLPKHERGAYRLNWDWSAVTKTQQVAVVASRGQWPILSNPVAGRKKNDVLYTTGLRFTFSREKW
jgi:hypothetical protein